MQLSHPNPPTAALAELSPGDCFRHHGRLHVLAAGDNGESLAVDLEHGKASRVDLDTIVGRVDAIVEIKGCAAVSDQTDRRTGDPDDFEVAADDDGDVRVDLPDGDYEYFTRSTIEILRHPAVVSRILSAWDEAHAG